MARGRGRKSQTVELFPFLAILACVIGVLTLVIAGLSLGALGALEIDESGKEYAELKSETAADLAEIERREQIGHGNWVLGRRIQHARRELASREAVSEDLKRLIAERAALRRKARQLRSERDTLEEAVRGLEDGVTKLEAEKARLGGARGAGPPIKVRGPRTRSGQRKLKPRFIECREDSIVVDADLEARARSVVPLTRLARATAFQNLLLEVKRAPRGGGIVILMVREGTVNAYDEVSSYCRRRGVRCGKLPVPGNGTIDYTPFKSGR